MFTFIKEKREAKNKAIIKEIHNSFDTAGELLIKEANEILGNSHKEMLRSKKSLLNECGFSNNKLSGEIKELEDKIHIGNMIKSYGNLFHNQYKVISLDDILKIGAKYKLCLASTSSYNEDVPEKNLLDIVNFKRNWEERLRNSSYKLRSFYKEHLLIMAPEKDFKPKSEFYAKHNKLMTFDDPIVLYPCNGEIEMSRSFYSGGELSSPYFYVVTKWGLEASDPLVVNEINN